MRLKFLFFPVMLVVSLAIFFGYVWPEFDNIKLLNQENIQSKAQYDQADNRQKAIIAMGEKIKQDPSTSDSISAYLPEKRSEEQVINNINFLATSDSVTLTNLAITNIAAKPQEELMPDTTLAPTPGFLSAGTVPVQIATNPEDSLQYTEATISASGTYNNLGIFLNQIQHSGMYNKVKSLSIKKDDQKDEQLLTASLVVDFGYLAPIKFNNQNLAKLQSGLDTNTLESLQKYISQKNQIIDLGSTSKDNPFQN